MTVVELLEEAINGNDGIPTVLSIDDLKDAAEVVVTDPALIASLRAQLLVPRPSIVYRM